MDLLLPTKTRRKCQEKKRVVIVLCRDKEEEETNVEKGLKGGKRKSTRKTKTGLAEEDNHGNSPAMFFRWVSEIPRCYDDK